MSTGFELVSAAKVLRCSTCRIIAADVFMIILGLFGGVNTHKFKWGYYAMGCFCELIISIGLVFNAMRSAMARGGGISKVYAGMAAYLTILWWGYPIVWGLAEGANVISSDAEVTHPAWICRSISIVALLTAIFDKPVPCQPAFADMFLC